MKRTAKILTLCAVVLALLAPSTVFASKSAKELKKEAERVGINEIADATLQRLLEENSKSKDLYEKAYGWAVFDNTKIAFGFSGGGGKGVVVRKEDGRRTYMKMGTAGVGFGVGVNKYQVVFLFQDKKTMNSFVKKGWQADAGATAAAGKESLEGKTNFVNGLAIYQLTEKGLMLNADLAGTKYWKDKDLN
jgi:lipid-binding SYLF domain-containing protein